MGERENYDLPYLTAVSLSDEFTNFHKIVISSQEHTIGRGLENSTIIPVLTISRNHCKLMQKKSHAWHLFDYSACGIQINDTKVGKGSQKKLCNGDIIKILPTDELTYKFVTPQDNEYNVPSKRMKLESNSSNTQMINNVKFKFEQSQNNELLHIGQKMETAKQITAKSMLLKQQLQLDMDKKMQQLTNDYAQQINKLTGAKNIVEQKTNSLIKERDAQLIVIKHEMEGKVAELMEQIKKHNENEAQLSMENNLLKEKLEKERQAFLAELLRESSSKKDMLEQLEKKIQEQENIRKKEKEELEDLHKKKNEQMRLTMEKELKQLEKQKNQREAELKKELESIKTNLEKQVKQVKETEEQELKAKQELIEKLQKMQQISDIEKVKVQKLEKEKEEMKQKHEEVQIQANKSIIDLMNQVEKATAITTLTTEKIQEPVDKSSEVIQTLQQELAMANNKLREKESNTTSQEIYIIDPEEGTSSKNSVLNEVGSIMENELQCSVCAELFIEATTLGCSHTFCAYCICMWKKKKKDCPVCRTPITTECRSLVLDSFIEKMVQNLSEEMKEKRQDMLKTRKEEAEGSGAYNNRPNRSIERSEVSDIEYTEGEESEESDSSDSDEFDHEWHDESGDAASDSSRGLDDASDTDRYSSTLTYFSGYRDYLRSIMESAHPIGRFSGGYDRCFECGARGHWARQCPFR